MRGDGAYDSYYYLYKNGELIDWWLGQYDDAATPHTAKQRKLLCGKMATILY